MSKHLRYIKQGLSTAILIVLIGSVGSILLMGVMTSIVKHPAVGIPLAIVTYTLFMAWWCERS